MFEPGFCKYVYFRFQIIEDQGAVMKFQVGQKGQQDCSGH